jgi:hypothetical protein
VQLDDDGRSPPSPHRANSARVPLHRGAPCTPQQRAAMLAKAHAQRAIFHDFCGGGGATPARSSASRPARSTAFFTLSTTARPISAFVPTRLQRSTHRKVGPPTIFETPSHARTTESFEGKSTRAFR